MKKPKFVQAIVNPGAWKLPKNEIWNIPEKPINEIRFVIEQLNNFAGIVISLTALVCDLEGRIYGIRKASNIKEQGYNSTGRISVNGKKYSCWTSSQLFEREDGSLCDVAILHIRKICEK
jgi:hypothetical protein